MANTDEVVQSTMVVSRLPCVRVGVQRDGPKRMNPTPQTRKAVTEEASLFLSNRIQHTNLVQYLDVFVTPEGTIIVVVSLVQGMDLGMLIERKKLGIDRLVRKTRRSSTIRSCGTRSVAAWRASFFWRENRWGAAGPVKT